MTDDQSTSADQHLELAAFHLHEAARAHQPDLPSWDSPEAVRADARFRVTGAHKRSIASCRLMAIERVAAALAILDGEPWPGCNRAVSPRVGMEQRQAIAAQRRQRYRHEARAIVAELYGYMEVKANDDTEEDRQLFLTQVHLQRDQDADILAKWRERINLPTTTVSQLSRNGDH